MALQITPEQQALVNVIFQTGGFSSESDVLNSALELLQRQRQLVSDVNAGVAALDADEYTEYGEDDRDRFRADIATEAESRRESAGS